MRTLGGLHGIRTQQHRSSRFRQEQFGVTRIASRMLRSKQASTQENQKEHIANREQTVYIGFHRSRAQRREGRPFVGPSNPGHKERDHGPGQPARHRRNFNGQGQVQGAGRGAVPDRAQLRQGLDHEARQERQVDGYRGRLHRLARPRHRARRRRPAARPRRRNLRAGILRQDHAGAAHRRRSPEEGRHLRLHRCRACARSDLCQKARRQCRRSADFAARPRRAGARDRRHAGALRRGRRAGDRFGRGAGAARRARRRDGRRAARHAGAPDEPGAAQAHRLDQQVEHHGDLHQPDPHEDRRDVRHARDHHRRQRAEVLRLGPPRHPPHRRDQGARRGGRQPDPRQGGQEQARAAVQAWSSSTSCTARACRRPAN